MYVRSGKHNIFTVGGCTGFVQIHSIGHWDTSRNPHRHPGTVCHRAGITPIAPNSHGSVPISITIGVQNTAPLPYGVICIHGRSVWMGGIPFPVLPMVREGKLE